MKAVKSPSAPKQAHTSNTKKGMGDYYGSGKPNPMGKQLSGPGINQLKPKRLSKPPKCLA
jgi:hypothetical protein